MTISVVPAAGLGKRLKSGAGDTEQGTKDVPKALVTIAGKPMVGWVMEALEQTPIVDGIVLVVPPSHHSEFERCCQALALRKPVWLVEGGEDRQQSVWHGLKALPPETEWVIVHDAARPLVTPALLVAVWEAAREIGSAAIAALPCPDTVKRSLDGVLIAETLDRQQIWLAQTPQVFAADLLLAAHEKALADGFTATDDAMLVERMGAPIRLVMGEPTNLKVTYPADLLLAEALLQGRQQKGSCNFEANSPSR